MLRVLFAAALFVGVALSALQYQVTAGDSLKMTAGDGHEVSSVGQSNCHATWASELLPVVDGQPVGFTDVLALSPTDGWALGAVNPMSPTARAVIGRWDGDTWELVTTPVINVSNTLVGLAASSPSDAWAVGQVGTNTLAEHWDGDNWSITPTPNDHDAQFTYLTGIAAISATDAWAVGFSLEADNTRSPLIIHWDGNT